MASEEAQMLPIEPPAVRFEAVIRRPADRSREDNIRQAIPRPDGLRRLLAILPGRKGRSTVSIERRRQRKAAARPDTKGKGVELPSGLHASSANRPATTPVIAAPESAKPASVHVPEAKELDASKLLVGEAGHSQAVGVIDEKDKPSTDSGRVESLASPADDGVGGSKDSKVSIGDNTAAQLGGIVSGPPLPPSQLERPDLLTQSGESAEPQAPTRLPNVASVITPLPTAVPQSTTAARGKEVMVPFSKLERVRTLQFRSSRMTDAREKRPNLEEKEKLRTFVSFVGTANQPELFGRLLLQCHLYLTEVEEPAGCVRTYICIEGLDDDNDIKNFHAAMCRRSNRKYYHPWGLCFKKLPVIRSVSRANVTSAEKHQQVSTLCGSLLSTTRNGESWKSTIGGVVDVNGQLFALTTSHTPHTVAPSGSSSGTYAASASGLSEADYPNDVEPALVLVFDEKNPDLPYPVRTTIAQGKPSELQDWTTSRTDANLEGDDWRLMRIDDKSIYLNYLGNFPQYEPVHYESNSIGSSSSSKQEPSPFQFLVDYTEDPSGHPATVKAGVTGYHSGQISLASSFLFGKDGPLEVWTVHLEDSDLARGDSGSWVVDVVDGSNYKVAGSVLAISPGKAYFRLLSEQFLDIRHARRTDDERKMIVRLPSPISGLLRLAQEDWSDARRERGRYYVAHILRLLGQDIYRTHPLALALREVDAMTNMDKQNNLEAFIRTLLKLGDELSSDMDDESRDALWLRMEWPYNDERDYHLYRDFMEEYYKVWNDLRIPGLRTFASSPDARTIAASRMTKRVTHQAAGFSERALIINQPTQRKDEKKVVSNERKPVKALRSLWSRMFN